MLDVLGAGFGRTGTLSLRSALEALGFSCYHMLDVPRHQGHVDAWAAAAIGESVSWQALLAGFDAAVDWPAAAFWQDIVRASPETRVILTIRDSASWYASFRHTILEKLKGPAPPKGSPTRAIFDVAERVVLERTFAGRADDSAHAIEVFEAHNRQIITSVDASKLLVYRIADGWGPLCRFLRLPVPADPFPHLNRRSSFLQRFDKTG